MLLQNLRGSNGNSKGMFDVWSSVQTLSPTPARRNEQLDPNRHSFPMASPTIVDQQADEQTFSQPRPLDHSPEKDHLLQYGKQLNDMALELQEWIAIKTS
jgi:hypothetical protein